MTYLSVLMLFTGLACGWVAADGSEHALRGMSIAMALALILLAAALSVFQTWGGRRQD